MPSRPRALRPPRPLTHPEPPAQIVLHDVLTEDNCSTWELTWWYFEAIAVIFFTVELGLRFVRSPTMPSAPCAAVRPIVP